MGDSSRVLDFFRASFSRRGWIRFEIRFWEYASMSMTARASLDGGRHNTDIKGSKRSTKEQAALAKRAIMMFKWDIPSNKKSSGSAGAFPYQQDYRFSHVKCIALRCGRQSDAP